MGAFLCMILFLLLSSTFRPGDLFRAWLIFLFLFFVVRGKKGVLGAFTILIVRRFFYPLAYPGTKHGCFGLTRIGTRVTPQMIPYEAHPCGCSPRSCSRGRQRLDRRHHVDVLGLLVCSRRGFAEWLGTAARCCRPLIARGRFKCQSSTPGPRTSTAFGRIDQTRPNPFIEKPPSNCFP